MFKLEILIGAIVETTYQKKKEIDSLCCQGVLALNSKIDNEHICCVTESKQFEILCTSEIVLKDVVRGQHQSKGDCLEAITSHQSFQDAAYEQFIQWVLNCLGKANRRVIPSCALWKIWKLCENDFPEPNAHYVNFSEEKRD